ncbi:MAG TPA: hypothetical protein VFP48_09730 [Steroidobacteraceae bacterium]|nr:hypothetical protein [Steroidobacteraceae bacterium]
MAARVSARGLAGAAGKKYWREAEARQVIQAWERSGQDLSGFAARHGLKAARLARWASRLGKRAVGRRGRISAGAAPLKLRFHPVALIGTTPAVETSAIEVVLLDGRRVRVPSGVASEDLDRVLGVLEGRNRC